MPPTSLTEPELRFIDEVAALFEPLGMPPTVGRFHAYLLLQSDPVALETIAADLQMSRSNAWNAARLLETLGHVRHRTAPGSKRALYFSSENYAGPILQHTALLGAMASLLRQAAPTVARDVAADRMRERAEFYHGLRVKIEAALTELEAKRATSP